MAWISTGDADTYFATRLGASDYWGASTDKAAALATAEADLINAGIWTFPDEAEQAQKDAVCEQALFLLRDPDAEDRANLMAQGVVTSSVVGETTQGASKVPIAPRAAALLTPYKTTGHNSVPWTL